MQSLTFACTRSSLLFLFLGLSVGCGDTDTTDASLFPVDATTAPRVEIDRFSSNAGTLQVRTASNGLPEAGQAIDYDQAPFLTHGLGPGGELTSYYNFDVQSDTPAPIYVLFREAATTPVQGQLNIIDVLPGDPGYSDFWQVQRVTVPSSYVANSLTSFEELTLEGLEISVTDTLVNCPVVPEGSTARLRVGGGSTGLVQGWYRGQVAHYFSFEEAGLTGTKVPVAPIYVTFNINPGEADGGPSSGFLEESTGGQTHNVLAALPDSSDYSPLWSVSPYDNADFDSVSDLASAEAANILAQGVALVNCPVAEIGEAM